MNPRHVVVAALGLAAATGSAHAGDPLRVHHTIETDHFVVHYYDPLEETARRIAEEHGGSLAFDTEVGKGTDFVLRLPLTGPSASGRTG